MAYTPDSVPHDPEQLSEFMRTELDRISNELAAISQIRLEVLHVAPSKPRDGDVILADGTDWDPGSGAGFYGYLSGSYVFLG